jgi:hypothetical protein
MLYIYLCCVNISDDFIFGQILLNFNSCYERVRHAFRLSVCARDFNYFFGKNFNFLEKNDKISNLFELNNIIVYAFNASFVTVTEASRIIRINTNLALMSSLTTTRW